MFLHLTGNVSALAKGVLWGGSLGEHRINVPKERSPPHPTNPFTPWTGALIADTTWKHRAGHHWGCRHKQETKENLLQKQNS